MTEISASRKRPNTRRTAFRRKSAPVALRVWFNIARDWTLTDAEAATLLGISRRTYRRWKANPEILLRVGTVERLSLLLGIYKDLQILLPRHDAADGWVKKANHGPLFNGQSPLQRMMAGLTEDLAVVRRHLDAECSG